MTGSCVRILQVPSPLSDAWLEALQKRCLEKGWAFFMYWGGELPVLPQGPSVVVGWGKDDLLPVADWIVQTCAPGLAVEALASKMNLEVGEARYHASARFALCSELAAEGAPVFDVNSPLEIPGLGEIPPPGSVVDTAGGGVLSFYDRIPPGVGEGVRWPAGIFSIPDCRGPRSAAVRIDLVGRRRLLLNGPNLSLSPGKWQAKAEISVEPAGGAEFLIEWGAGAAVEAKTFFIEMAGDYEIDFVYTWAESAPADFRVSLMTPVLEGWLDFKGISLVKTQNVSSF